LSVKETIDIHEILRKYPQARSVLARFGVAPGQRTTLAVAASEKHIPVNLLLAALEEIGNAPPARDDVLTDWAVADTNELIDYIERQHHTYLRRELPHLEHLLKRVMKTHRRRYGTMLGALQATLASLRIEIEEHLRVEEQILFPRVRDIEHHRRNGGSPLQVGGTFVDVVAMDQMKYEHELVDAALTEIRKLTSNYRPPEEACERFAALYVGLATLATKLREHVDLENTFLWPANVRGLTRTQNNLLQDTVGSVYSAQNICPRTHQPCTAGSYAQCNCFWDCIAEEIGLKRPE